MTLAIYIKVTMHIFCDLVIPVLEFYPLEVATHMFKSICSHDCIDLS